MRVLEEKVAELEARLAELEPVLREAEELRESIASLKAIMDREGEFSNSNSGIQEATKRPYLSIESRIEQVSEILRKNPDATNIEIAETLGVTAARVSQIRSRMGEAS